MRVIVSEFADASWAEWLERFNGNIYHSIEWADMFRTSHSRPLFFHWLNDNDKCIGLAVGIESWSPMRYIGRLSKRLNLETYPAVRGSAIDLVRSMIGSIMQFAKEEDYRGLTIQSYFVNVMLQGLERLGFTTKPRIEFIVDLSRPHEELWTDLSEHHRRKIKKASKHGLLFEEASSIDAMLQLRMLQLFSLNRRIGPGGHIDMPNEIVYEKLAKDYFEKNLGKLFVMTRNNKAVSAALISLYAGRAYYVYGGSNDEGFKTDAPALLFWEIFSRCRELGYRELNLGGVPASAAYPDSPSHGLYRFKANFGGRQVACMSGSVEELKPFRGWLASKAKKTIQLLSYPTGVHKHNAICCLKTASSDFRHQGLSSSVPSQAGGQTGGSL